MKKTEVVKIIEKLNRQPDTNYVYVMDLPLTKKRNKRYITIYDIKSELTEFFESLADEFYREYGVDFAYDMHADGDTLAFQIETEIMKGEKASKGSRWMIDKVVKWLEHVQPGMRCKTLKKEIPKIEVLADAKLYLYFYLLDVMIRLGMDITQPIRKKLEKEIMREDVHLLLPERS